MAQNRPTKRARTRVIQTVAFDLLPDQVADRMIQYGRMLMKHRSSMGRNMPFHRPVMPDSAFVSQRYQIVVHDFLGAAHKASFTDLFIAGSHRHPEFFRELQRVLKGTPVESGNEQYVGLTLDWLNAVVGYLKHGVISNKSALKADVLKQRLTAAQIDALPERFSAFTVPMDQTFVMVVDTRVLRRPCYSMQSRTVRWKYVFNCVALERPGDRPEQTEAWPTNASVPQFARRHEVEIAARVTGTDCKVLLEDPWPYHVSTDTAVPEGLPALLRDSLEQYGVACVPLSHDHVAQYTTAVATYLGRLMRLPDPAALLDVAFVKDQLTSESETTLPWLYRTKNQCSRHVHVLTGRTLYGHYCLTLKKLFQDLECLVRGAFAAGPEANLWATTAEIVLQY